MFCCYLLRAHSGFAIILFWREEPLAVPWVYLQFVVMVFPDHTQYNVLINVRRLRLISYVTNSKHVFFHFVVYLFLKIFLVLF